MNIGFDLDKVFINTPPLIPKFVIENLYKKKDYGTLQYRIPNKIEQIFRRLTHLSILRPPIKENLEFIKTLKKEKNKFYLISSRFKFLEKNTNELVKLYGLDKIFERMYFNFRDEQPHIFKNRIIKILNLNYYIDDDLSLLKYTAKDNPKTVFFWLDDSNKNNSQKNNNIIQIKALSEILSFT